MLIPGSVPLLYPAAFRFNHPHSHCSSIASLLLSAPSFMADIYNIGATEQFQTLFGCSRRAHSIPVFFDPGRSLSPSPFSMHRQRSSGNPIGGTRFPAMSMNLFILHPKIFRPTSPGSGATYPRSLATFSRDKTHDFSKIREIFMIRR